MSGIRSVEETTGRRRREVLRLLRSSPAPMSIVAIAEELGVHPNTVRFHLDSLVGDGQVEQVEPGRKGPGRPALMFQAVRQMDRGGTRHYRMLAEILTMALATERNPRAKAMAAGASGGERWRQARNRRRARHERRRGDRPPGRRARRPGVRAGAPDVQRGAPGRPAALPVPGAGRNPEFRRLPHPPRADAGALETWAAPVSVDRLDAFVEPDLCLAHLTPVGAAG